MRRVPCGQRTPVFGMSAAINTEGLLLTVFPPGARSTMESNIWASQSSASGS